jgi:hypothetical protein
MNMYLIQRVIVGKKKFAGVFASREIALRTAETESKRGDIFVVLPIEANKLYLNPISSAERWTFVDGQLQESKEVEYQSVDRNPTVHLSKV